MVHDLTNRKSYLNLRKWLAEVLNAGKESSGMSGRKTSRTSVTIDMDNEEEYDPEQFADNQVPILIVGTKMDQSGTSRTDSSVHGVNLAEEVGADSISLDCSKTREICQGSVNKRKLNMFLDKVIERCFFSRKSSQAAFFQDVGRLDGWKERSNKRKFF